MKTHLKPLAGVSLFVAAVAWIALGQSATEAPKNCIPPQETYSPEPPPSHDSLDKSASVLLNVLIDDKGRAREAKLARDLPAVMTLITMP